MWTAKALTAPPSGASGHIPSNPPNGTLTIACESCHSATEFTTFSGTVMKHAFVTTMKCDGLPRIRHDLEDQYRRLWVRDGPNHHAGVDCGGSGCHSSRDKQALRRAASHGQRGRGDRARQCRERMRAHAAGHCRGHRSPPRAAGTPCVSCHNGAGGTGRPPGHIATSDNCASCHNTLAWLPVTTVDHTQVQGSCFSCHNGRSRPARAATTSPAVLTARPATRPTPGRRRASITSGRGTHLQELPRRGARRRAARSTTCPPRTVRHLPRDAGMDAREMDHTTLTGNCASCHDNRVAWA